MAFGFPPKYSEQFQLEELDAQQCMAIAFSAVLQLKWQVTNADATVLKANTPFSMSTYGDVVTITVADNVATLESYSTGRQIVDYGKNKKNISALIAKLTELKNNPL